MWDALANSHGESFCITLKNSSFGDGFLNLLPGIENERRNNIIIDNCNNFINLSPQITV